MFVLVRVSGGLRDIDHNVRQPVCVSGGLLLGFLLFLLIRGHESKASRRPGKVSMAVVVLQALRSAFACWSWRFPYNKSSAKAT